MSKNQMRKQIYNQDYLVSRLQSWLEKDFAPFFFYKEITFNIYDKSEIKIS